MKPKTRLYLALVVAAVLSFLLATGLLYANLRRAALAAAEHEALLLMSTAQSVRRYTSDNVAPVFERQSMAFDPVVIPSHAASTTMGYLERLLPEQRYHEVALNPTNPAHLAQGWTAELLDELRRTGSVSRVRLSREDGQEWLHMARPIRMDKPQCLGCHGDPASLPEGVRARFGTRGTGWALGSVVGAQIVTTSVSTATARLWPTFTLSLASITVALLVVFLTLNLMLQRLVLRPAEVHNRELRRLALRDSLTGAANRRRFMDELGRRIAECEGQQLALSVVMVDLDHFKAVNDRHGHAVGDAVLQETVRRLRRRVRKGDLVGRLGGEEFAVLLPDADLRGAHAHAEQLLRALSQRPFETVGSVTASLGVAQWNGRETAAALLMRADAALYLAKRSGRARVVLAPAALESLDIGAPQLV